MAGDELSLVGDYFPEESVSTGDDYEDRYDEGVEPSSATPEQSLVDEYRESSFDAGEVQEWRQAAAGVAAGEYTADDYLAAYEDENDYSGEYEADADALIDLGNGQAATPEEWAASMEQQGITPEMLVEAWAAEHPNERLTQHWLHLQNLNEVLDERQTRQAAEQDAQLAQAEVEARGLVAASFRAAGAGRVERACHRLRRRDREPGFRFKEQHARPGRRGGRKTSRRGAIDLQREWGTVVSLFGHSDLLVCADDFKASTWWGRPADILMAL